MSRPKGSKNKKTLLLEAQLGERIEAQRAEKKRLEKEQKKLAAEMDGLKQKIRNNKKALRAAERTLAAMQERQKETAAAARAATQKQEIEKVVSTLIQSGKGADEILDMLQK